MSEIVKDFCKKILINTNFKENVEEILWNCENTWGSPERTSQTLGNGNIFYSMWNCKEFFFLILRPFSRKIQKKFYGIEISRNLGRFEAVLGRISKN